MSARARFKVSEVAATETGCKVRMYPVADGGGLFFTGMPSGQLEMGIVSPDAAAVFTPGAEFDVDFTPASP